MFIFRAFAFNVVPLLSALVDGPAEFIIEEETDDVEIAAPAAPPPADPRGQPTSGEGSAGSNPPAAPRARGAAGASPTGNEPGTTTAEVPESGASEVVEPEGGGAEDAAPTQVVVSAADWEAMQDRIQKLERKFELAAAMDAAAITRTEERTRFHHGLTERPHPVGVGFGNYVPDDDWGLRYGGYLQLQYQWSQLSEDQLLQGGTPLNRNRFMVRRGRFSLNGDWKYFAFGFQLDGSTTRGLFLGIRQAHVSVLWRNPDRSKPPYIMVTAGLTEVPFGFEVRLGQREMIFMERSTGSLAFFPGPVDVGLRVRGGVSVFRYDLAVMNGSPLDDRAGGQQGIDPTSRPDIAGRLGFEVPKPKFFVAGGVSFLTGRGFHAGRDATKNQVQWQDLNENGTIDSGELVAVPGISATPSFTFSRWAANVDAQVGVKSRIGWSQLWAEVTVASNLDRGLYVSDPIAVGADLRQLQVYGAFIQDLTRWAVLGFRYEFYDPNTDALDRRRGTFVPAKAGMHTFSPLVGAVLPAGITGGLRGRVVFQYDAVIDALGRDSRGVPVDLKNDQFTVRVQGEF